MQSRNDLTRAKRYFEARDVDPESLARVQQAIAVELLGPEIVARDAEVAAFSQHRCLSSFEATQLFAKELQCALTWCASKLGAKAPKSGKYDPLFSTSTMFRDVWEARQDIDDLGIPYAFYTQHAVECWTGQGETRMPRPRRLCSPPVIAHVVGKWSEVRSGAAHEECAPLPLDGDGPLLEPDPRQDGSGGLTAASAASGLGPVRKSASDEALQALMAADARDANR